MTKKKDTATKIYDSMKKIHNLMHTLPEDARWLVKDDLVDFFDLDEYLNEQEEICKRNLKK